jgi:septal ring factor EnvC (AmiA/AmiB activator)
VPLAMTLDNLDKLEAIVNRLIELHQRVKQEKASVESKLQTKETEWHDLQGQLRRYERERSEIREKLDKIIGQFANLDLPE